MTAGAQARRVLRLGNRTYVFWVGQLEGVERDGVHYRFSPDLQNWSMPLVLINDLSIDAPDVDILAAQDGSVVVAHRRMLQQFSVREDGVLLPGNQVELRPEVSDWEDRPSLAQDGCGHFWVGLRQARDELNQGSGRLLAFVSDTPGALVFGQGDTTRSHEPFAAELPAVTSSVPLRYLQLLTHGSNLFAVAYAQGAVWPEGLPEPDMDHAAVLVRTYDCDKDEWAAVLNLGMHTPPADRFVLPPAGAPRRTLASTVDVAGTLWVAGVQVSSPHLNVYGIIPPYGTAPTPSLVHNSMGETNLLDFRLVSDDRTRAYLVLLEGLAGCGQVSGMAVTTPVPPPTSLVSSDPPVCGLAVGDSAATAGTMALVMETQWPMGGTDVRVLDLLQAVPGP
jgi:hypothetical protein